jgi:peptidoglycan/LPS O-acetylase OafA/YrhL
MARGTTGATVRLPYWPALDGLRGAAVAAVLVFHGGFAWARGGYLGVSAFFTLSGFLITSLLLTEWRDTGRISLRRFWARRARRLMPAALLGLAGAVLFGAFLADPDQVRSLRTDVLAALGDVANWRFVFSGQSYADLFAAPSPVLHFWSLAIEEQFYLCFPLIAFLFLRWRGSRGLAIALVVAAGVSIELGRVLLEHGASRDRLYYGTDTRAFELLAGAVLALVIARGATPRRRVGRGSLQLAGVLALIAMVGMWGSLEQSDLALYQGGFIVHALLAAVVVAAAVQPVGPVRALLGLSPLRRLGLVSYGVYVYHWPVFLWLDTDRTGLSNPALFALRTAVTLGLAIVSYHLLERPIRAGSRLTGRRRFVVAPAAALSLTVALVAVTANPPAPSIVYSAVFDQVPPPPPEHLTPAPLAAPDSTAVPGTPTASAPPVSSVRPASPSSTQVPSSSLPAAPPRPLRIMVVGDSVGQTVGRGIERWGARTGAAVVRNAAIGWCAIGRGGVIHLFDTGTVEQAGCVDFPERWDIDNFRPDLVVVLSTLWEIAPRSQPQWDGIRRFGDPEYDSWLRAEYQAAKSYLLSEGARVVWLTAPCARPTPSRDAFWSGAGGEAAAVVRLNGLIKALPGTDASGRLRVVDLFAGVCPGGEFSQRLGDVQEARPDGLHSSDPGADWVTEWLCRDLTEDARACS